MRSFFLRLIVLCAFVFLAAGIWIAVAPARHMALVASHLARIYISGVEIESLEFSSRSNAVLKNVKIPVLHETLVIPEVNLKLGVSKLILSFTSFTFAEVAHDMGAEMVIENPIALFGQHKITLSMQDNQNHKVGCNMLWFAGILRVNDCNLQFGEAKLMLNGKLGRKRINIKTTFEKLPIEALSSFTKHVDNEVLKFVQSNTKGGYISGELNCDISLKQPKSLTKESLNGTLNVEKIELRYDDDLPPVQDIAAEVKIAGDQIKAIIKGGRSDNIQIVSGVVNCILNNPKPITIALKAKGPASSVNLFVPSADKDGELKNIKFEQGEVRANVDVMVFTENDEVRYKVSGVASDVTANVKNSTLLLSKGDLSFSVDKKEIVVSGTCALNDNPAEVNFTQDVPSDKVLVDVKLSLDNLLGSLVKPEHLPELLAQYQYKGGVESLNFKANLEKCLPVSSLLLTDDGTGDEASELLLEAVNTNQQMDKFQVRIKNKDKVILDTQLDYAAKACKKVRIDSPRIQDGNFSISFKKGAAALQGTAAKVDLTSYSKIADSLVTRGSKGSWSVDVSAEQVLLNPSAPIEGLKFIVEKSGNTYSSTWVEGAVNSKSFKASLLSSDEKVSKWDLVAEDAGAFLKACNVYDRMSKGQLKASFGQFHEEGDKITGSILVTDFESSKSPLLARIFAAASITGTLAMLKSTLPFTKLVAHFDLHDQQLKVHECIVHGASLDLKMKGKLDLAGKAYSWKGLAIPGLYGLNNAIASLPIMNIVSKKNKIRGITAFPFELEGKY